MPNEVKLLPCPFCEGHGGIFQDDGDFYVCCTGCWSKSPLKEHKDEAIAAWNTRPTIVTDEVVERPDVVKALWAIFMRIDTMPKSNKNMGLDVWTIKTLQLVRETIDLAAMPAIVGGE